MCEALQELMKDEITEKVTEKVTESKLEDVKNIMKKLSYTAEQAMDLLSVSESQRKLILDKLQ